MKKLSLTLVAISAFAAGPAMACGMMNQASAAGGMMCGKPASAAEGQSSQTSQAGGCTCCRNMAMMQNTPMQNMPGSMPGMQMPGMHHNLPPAPSAPPAPEPPKQ